MFVPGTFPFGNVSLCRSIAALCCSLQRFPWAGVVYTSLLSLLGFHLLRKFLIHHFSTSSSSLNSFTTLLRVWRFGHLVVLNPEFWTVPFLDRLFGKTSVTHFCLQKTITVFLFSGPFSSVYGKFIARKPHNSMAWDVWEQTALWTRHGPAWATRNTFTSATWKSISGAFSSWGSISQLMWTFSLVFPLVTGRFGSAGCVRGGIFEPSPQSLCSRVHFFALSTHPSQPYSTNARTQAASWSCCFWSWCSLGFWEAQRPFVPALPPLMALSPQSRERHLPWIFLILPRLNKHGSTWRDVKV